MKVHGFKTVADSFKIYSSYLYWEKFLNISITCFYVDGLYVCYFSWHSLRYACWIQCHLWTHFQHSEWNNGKWLFSCWLMHCPFVEYLLLSHTWRIGGPCFTRWDHVFILCWFIILIYITIAVMWFMHMKHYIMMLDCIDILTKKVLNPLLWQWSIVWGSSVNFNL